MAKVPPYNTEFEEHPAQYRETLSVIKRIVLIVAVTFTTVQLAYASPQHSGAECYHNGHWLYVPDGAQLCLSGVGWNWEASISLAFWPPIDPY